MNHKSKSCWSPLFAQLLFAYSAAYAVTPNLPSWDDVRKIVDQQLNSVGDYQPGDLISRNQVDPIFDVLHAGRLDGARSCRNFKFGLLRSRRNCAPVPLWQRQTIHAAS